jgi:hypothetical protein
MQVKTFGSSVSIPVCYNNSVQVGCLMGDHLGVNVTWKSQMEDIPVASLPDLRDIGMFLCTATLKKPGNLSESQSPHLFLEPVKSQCLPVVMKGESQSPGPREGLCI